ncbi:BPTI/Kunitz domain-containing protein [Ixodes scapularis]|uniref:BPTI/Kunitz domain-containing protein n=1 Tax=Ixodes scapularis TaxID=6945 RepID=UPI001A9F5157|nr:BPTI/Kunitz domain-containing protein [Ixodes scapularis]
MTPFKWSHDSCFGNSSSSDCAEGNSRTQRWTFNIEKQTCVNITTCLKNQSMFPTELECQAACKTHTLCYQPRAVTGCYPRPSEMPPRTWHFDSETERCVQDTNCANVRNKFKTKRECRKACPYGGTGHPCNLKEDDGHDCKRAKPSLRWYWNKQESRCIRFTYKGCKGNNNNFYSNTSCAAICKRDVY